MLFNTTYQLGGSLDPLTQDEILGTPEFYAMSFEEVVASGKAPAHLKRVLLSMPWSGRPNYVQVRPQDFRQSAPYILGGGWHLDLNTNLNGGETKVAKSLDEFRSMVVSFGDVVETEFVRDPIEIPDSIDPFNHCQFAEYVLSKSPPVVRLGPNQVATYTSRDIHRVAPNIRLGRARLIIVTVECDEPLPQGAGRIGPSILEKNGR